MITPLFIGIGTQEILFIILVVLLFFGGKKIPELMKGIGKGVRSFKEGMNGMGTTNEKTKPEKEEALKP
ncbi:Sec-independent protein translocase subunit TatA/TatB [Gabonibacter chumensis]|uniref:Sec-independent protein translocase subunit TatA/TatB n=1 Tax=Gabonibacter chumensis TaxID=2972474 RepID=UPI0025738929|nr:twin-arginine translocase TatA/TatE family subunit [Gabonibacter chumensis]MCR9011862.1 twin-arginine translocase TatA/TatE family subunit [Gabonibacter chumensis]